MSKDQLLYDHLVRARARLDAGWTKGQNSDVDGNVCSYGALFDASGVEPGACPGRDLRDNDPLFREAELVLTCILIGKGFNSIVAFNDAEETTKEMVLELFDDAIALINCRIVTERCQVVAWSEPIVYPVLTGITGALTGTWHFTGGTLDLGITPTCEPMTPSYMIPDIEPEEFTGIANPHVEVERELVDA